MAWHVEQFNKLRRHDRVISVTFALYSATLLNMANFV